MYCDIKIKDKIYKCFYETNNKYDLQPLILLHGWGVDSSIYNNIIEKLNYYVITFDFLGFGKSDNIETVFNLNDYVSQLTQVIAYFNLNNIILLGHSFGGRVAIKYTKLYNNTTKLILVDSAGVKHKTLKLLKKIYKYKILKKIYYIFNKEKYQNLITNSGSSDYKILSSVMKQTMTKIINEDVRKYCKKNQTKTLLLWGYNDLETKLTDGYIFNQLLMNSELIIFYNSSHFPFITEKEKFIKILNSDKND